MEPRLRAIFYPILLPRVGWRVAPSARFAAAVCESVLGDVLPKSFVHHVRKMRVVGFPMYLHLAGVVFREEAERFGGEAARRDRPQTAYRTRMAAVTRTIVIMKAISLVRSRRPLTW